MNNWGIVGHEWAVELLARALAGDRLGHAYLFVGPPAIGKRTLAVKFAQAINCLSPARDAARHVGGGAEWEPCGGCRPCALIVRSSHPDVPFVHSGFLSPAPSWPRSEAGRLPPAEPAYTRTGAEARNSVKIEQVRELQRQLALSPYEAKYRTPILLRFHEATTAAQNALLKTLEEPPPPVVLLLTADSADLLLPTIVSRCELLHLRPLPIAAVQQALITRWGAAADRAQLLAHLSAGRLGWAARLSADDEQLEQRAGWLGEMLGLLAAPRRARLAYAEAWAKRQRVDIEESLALWQSWWRDVLLAASRADAPLANVDRVEAIRRLAQQVGAFRARATIESLRKTSEALERNANLRLALEVLALDLPSVDN